MPRFLFVFVEALLCFLISAGSSSSSSLSSSSSETSIVTLRTYSTHSRFFSTYSPNPWSHPIQRQHPNCINPNPCNSHDYKFLHGGSPSQEVVYANFPADVEDMRHEECQNETLTVSTYSLKCFLIPAGYGVDLHKNQSLRVAELLIWLLVLFYMLGTTASDYFSCTLEKLSEVWRLSPAVAGVTLLAIGNGAPDVFSSMAAFLSSDQSGNIGFSSVLGGALFVTTVVSGSVALVTARGSIKNGGSHDQRISSVCFFRDVFFLLASLGLLTGILLDGKVRLWESISFFSVYVAYTACVWAAEMLENHHRSRGASSLVHPLITKDIADNALLPQWSNPQPLGHHYHIHSQDLQAELEHYLATSAYHAALAKVKRYTSLIYRYGIELPLAVPRRLTIPIIEEERWSRRVAVASCVLAPLFVGGVYLFQAGMPQESVGVTLCVSGAMGILLGLLGLFTTENARPPSRCVWLWLAGGFVMSIVWFYIVADRLVECLETMGSIFQISPAILGLTVLAWGNSIGDLVADLALACRGGDCVKIAVSGCYAGPLFNTVFGLGLSLIVACAKAYPEPLIIVDEDGSLFFIMGFLGAGLAWALLMIPLTSMRLSKTLGCGLLLLYCGFLITGFCYAMGWIQG